MTEPLVEQSKTPLRRHVATWTLCEDTGHEAEAGRCPIHGGDRCLIVVGWVGKTWPEYAPSPGHMRIMVTGSRDWTDPSGILQGLCWVAAAWRSKTFTLVHGAARGADSFAAGVAEALGWDLEPHPPDYAHYPKYWAPKQRNIEMAESGIDYWVAFQIGESSGTAHAISELKKRGIPGTLYQLRDYGLVAFYSASEEVSC